MISDTQMDIEAPLWSRNYGEDEEDGFVDPSAPVDPNAPPPTPVIPHAAPVWTWIAAPAAGAALATPLLIVAVNPLSVAALCASLAPPAASNSGDSKSAPAISAKGAVKDPAPFPCIGHISIHDQPAPAAAFASDSKSDKKAAASKPAATTTTPSTVPLFAHSAGVYQLSKGASATTDAVVVLLHTPLPPERAFQWTATLFQRIHPNRVLVVDTMNESQYQPPSLHAYAIPAAAASTDSKSGVKKSKQPATAAAAAVSSGSTADTAVASPSTPPAAPPLVRSIVTSGVKAADSKIKVLTPALEVPNIATALAAAIISHCEVYSLNAELYLSLYSPHFVYESLSAFEPVFAGFGLSASAFNGLALKAKRAVYEWWCRLYRLPVASADRLASSLYL